ncbi:MAG: class I SAM-dependent rRNA methyltransferase, partial [Planctomycetes bacterium]|nr:class I SAM-dependent rRNA methyltransferase [Planctomycetota bacterium]
REALVPGPAIGEGAVVGVTTRDGRVLATGFWDTRSPIAVRVLAVGELRDAEAEIDRRLKAALKRRLDHFDFARTNAFRWVHGEADRLPGLHLDLYDSVAVARLDGQGAQAFYSDLGKRLERAAGPLRLEAVVDRLSGEPLLGAPPASLVVRENGVLFEVSPGKGGKGGLFLDQRENREEVERRAKGLAVLNLFSASGGFSLYAARGGAASTDTVDISRHALAAARRNFRLNDLTLENARFYKADAFDFLEAAARARKKWGLVISDPPSFAPNRASVGRAMKAYDRLHRLCAAVTAPGGTLCAASCSSHVGEADFVASVRFGVQAAGRKFVLEETRGAAADHPVLKAFPEGDYLKFVIGTVA